MDPARSRAGSGRRRRHRPSVAGSALQRLHPCPPRVARARRSPPRRPGLGGSGRHPGRRVAAAVGRLRAGRAGRPLGERERLARVRAHHRRGHRRHLPVPCRRAGAVVRRAAWEEPRLFEEIRRLGAVAEEEMDRVFNRGIGMALVVNPAGTTACSRLCRPRGGPRSSSARSSPGPACSSHEQGGRLPRVVWHPLEHSVKTGDFTLKSGRKSTWFIDSKQTVCRPDAMLLVADAVLSVVPPEATAIGGLPWARPGRLRDGRRRRHASGPAKAFSVRKEAKDHGRADASPARSTPGTR